MTTDTLYFLRDLLHDQVLSASSPDFRHRAQLVINALDELDAAILAAPLAGGSAPSPTPNVPAAADFFAPLTAPSHALDDVRTPVYGGSN